jgi:hypothetical protein
VNAGLILAPTTPVAVLIGKIPPLLSIPYIVPAGSEHICALEVCTIKSMHRKIGDRFKVKISFIGHV